MCCAYDLKIVVHCDDMLLKICGMHGVNKVLIHCAQHCSNAVMHGVKIKFQKWYLIIGSQVLYMMFKLCSTLWRNKCVMHGAVQGLYRCKNNVVHTCSHVFTTFFPTSDLPVLMAMLRVL